MENIGLALLIGVGVGTVLSLFVAPRSLKEKPLYGGLPSQVFHYLGVLGFCSTVPTVITTVILHEGFLRAVLLALSLSAFSFVTLVIHAAFEKPASDRHTVSVEDDVWTAEKAKTSGL